MFYFLFFFCLNLPFYTFSLALEPGLYFDQSGLDFGTLVLSNPPKTIPIRIYNSGNERAVMDQIRIIQCEV